MHIFSRAAPADQQALQPSRSTLQIWPNKAGPNQQLPSAPGAGRLCVGCQMSKKIYMCSSHLQSHTAFTARIASTLQLIYGLTRTTMTGTCRSLTFPTFCPQPLPHLLQIYFKWALGLSGIGGLDFLVLGVVGFPAFGNQREGSR